MNNYPIIVHSLLPSAKELFKKAEADQEALRVEPWSKFKAIDCAFSCWHLVDWVWHEYESHRDIGSLRQDFFISCTALKVFHDLANGNKHRELSRPKSDMSSSAVQNDYAQQGYAQPGYFKDEVRINFTDGTQQPMLQLVESAMNFWRSYFASKP